MRRSTHASAGILMTAFLCMAVAPASGHDWPVYVEKGPVELTVLRHNGLIVPVETESVWKPFCGSNVENFSVDDLKEVARRVRAQEAAPGSRARPANPINNVAGATPSQFNLNFNITTSLPAGALEALAQVERYIEAQFEDPITVTVNFGMQPLGSGVLGATNINYVTVSWPNTRNGLQNGMDPSDTIQAFLPSGSTIPVRYNISTGTITNEDRVFVARANHLAAIGSTFGTAATITFSSNFNWDYTPPSISGGTFCFQSVIIHEVGHALGFASGADFRNFDMEMLDVYRFQFTDGSGDYNPDTEQEFMATPRLVWRDSSNISADDVVSDLIAAEYRMSDGVPSQASHFRSQSPNIGIMAPSIGPGTTFYPNFFRQPDLNMFDAIGYDYPLSNTTCDEAALVACNWERNYDNRILTGTPNPSFSCGIGSSHIGTLWFQFTAEQSSARIDTCESLGTDSTWAIYSGNCGSLVQVACSEDGGCPGGGNNSSICVNDLMPGETYYLQVASKSSAGRGSFKLQIECSCEGACCLPPPTGCLILKEQDCEVAGGIFKGGGSVCPAEELDLAAFCAAESAVVSQFATGGQESLESNVDWSDQDPNATVAEEFRADGRPIRAIRWWGASLDEAVEPDGWMISFHEPLSGVDPAGASLGLYFCGTQVVTTDIASMALEACDALPVSQYYAVLEDCCLIHSGSDSRTAHVPAEADGFLGETCTDYELSVAAWVASRFDFDGGSGECVETSTATTAPASFWGWHTSAIESAGGPAVSGPLDMSGMDWLHGPWTAVSPACGEPNMAMELLTTTPASAIQVGWDNGIPNNDQRLNSQMGGQIANWFTVDDVEFEAPVDILEIEWQAEEENAFVWSSRTRLEIFPDNGADAPDDSGGPIAAIWVPDDLGVVTRTSLGAGAFFPRYRYRITEINLAIPAGKWWFGLASEGATGSGRTFWLTSRTGPVSGGQAHFRYAAGGFPEMTPWSTLLVGQTHDMAFKIRVAAPRDCNCNGIPDHEELLGGAPDCNGNFVLDECETDCNGNGIPDDCEIADDPSIDCNDNGILDVCDIALGLTLDSDGDGVMDECDICPGFDDHVDSDGDGVPDGCDVCPGFDDNLDSDLDGIPDDCDNCDLFNPDQADCNENGVGDICDIAAGTSRDCNQNGIPDECEGIPPTEAPVLIPGGPDMIRFIALVPNNAGIETAIRITLTSLHDIGPPDFSASEGQKRWIGPVSLCLDSSGPFSSFWCATLQCTPHYENWENIVGADAIYVTGSGIVPSSTYHAQAAPDGCDPSFEVSFSESLKLTTSKWGDLVAGGGGPPDGIVNVLDVAAVVDKIKDTSLAIARPRVLVRDNEPNPASNVNVIDLSLVVSALLSAQFPYAGPSACP